MVDFTQMAELQERDRALAVIEKAQRNNWNVVESLVTHMVSRTLIEELTGVMPVHEKKVREDKSAKLREWVHRHLGQTISPFKLSQELGVSYDNALIIIKDNVFYFTKVKKGVYEIRDGYAEREEAKANK